MLFVRNGRMSGSKNFSFESAALSASDALGEFILRYYREGSDIPEQIIAAERL